MLTRHSLVARASSGLHCCA